MKIKTGSKYIDNQGATVSIIGVLNDNFEGSLYPYIGIIDWSTCSEGGSESTSLDRYDEDGGCSSNPAGEGMYDLKRKAPAPKTAKKKASKR